MLEFPKRYADAVARLRVPSGFLIVLAFGWQGRDRVVYRLALQAVIVGSLGAYQGGLMLMAG